MRCIRDIGGEDQVVGYYLCEGNGRGVYSGRGFERFGQHQALMVPSMTD